MPYNKPLTAQQLVAHRGYQRIYPENTALSVRQAIKAGALFVEIDIQLSRDQQPVVYHDISLQRVSNCKESISDLSLEQLKQLSAYEPERLGDAFIKEPISSLQTVVEIIKQHPAVTLFIELKEESIEYFGEEAMLKNVCAILKPIAQRAVLISFDYSIIQTARRKGWPQVGVVLRDWLDINSPEVQAISSEYTFVDYKIIPPQTDLERLKTKLVAYEVGTVELARKLTTQKVPIFETFDIQGLLKSTK